ncbi:uncharacterized protein LOC133728670 [Rosa rugosa]|uniref:uncharacterized protein LOC133728670 n=1 Tax=Rosa rugosa TaxID=74645 RepID=UPI002B4184F4|nr:uncharacterized protein LOC133728670 [Rosa rugosa]
MRSREIGLLIDQLQTLFSLPLSTANQEECSALNAKLECSLAEEDANWKQRSKDTSKGMEDLVLHYFSTMFESNDINSIHIIMLLSSCSLSTEGVFSLKLDMSEAYDRMEFSGSCSIEIGFHRVMDRCDYKVCDNLKYAFLVNGQPKGHLTPTRGLRQGDPLSPHLFLLCIEVFSALLERKVRNGELQGIKVCEGAPIIHHLLFADDSLLFGKATLHECHHIQNVLHNYELASGQQINFSKSSIVFSKRVPEVDNCAITGFLGVSIEVEHEKYLGLLIYLGRNRTKAISSCGGLK